MGPRNRNRPSFQKHAEKRLEQFRSKNKLRAQASSINLQTIEPADSVFTRKEQKSSTLQRLKPSEKDIRNGYLQMELDNNEQHIILRTLRVMSTEDIEQILCSGDDNNVSTLVVGSVIIDACDSTAVLPLKSSAAIAAHMLVHSFPQSTIPKHLLDVLSLSNDNLNLAWPSMLTQIKRGSRGLFPSRHFCCWWKVGRFKAPFMSADYRGTSRTAFDLKLRGSSAAEAILQPSDVDPDVYRFLLANKGLWKLIDSLVETHYPEVSNVLKSLALPEGCSRVAGMFTCLALNNDAMTTLHRDSGDWAFGLCVVVSFGSAKGGELVICEEAELQVDDGSIHGFKGIILPGQTGSIVMFRSALVRHFNMPFTHGKRNSLVLFTDKTLLCYEPNKWAKHLDLGKHPDTSSRASS